MANVINEFKSSLNRTCLKCVRTSLSGKERHSKNDYKFCDNENGGGTMSIGNGPLSYIYGNTQQYRLPGKYSGVQCTSMALAAIIYQKAFPSLTPVGINAILAEGHKLHTRLRDDIRLSENPDRRVAIEDFPSKKYLLIGKVFGRETCVRLRQECDYVFTSRKEGFEGFYTIDGFTSELRYVPFHHPTSNVEYLGIWFSKRKRSTLGFLLTVGQYSHAVLLNENGSVLLFDSHGQFKHEGQYIKRSAGAVECPSLTDLAKFLIKIYGEGRNAAIAMVCVHFLRTPYALKGVNRDARKRHGYNYKPVCLKAEDKTARISIPEIQVDGVLLSGTVKDSDDWAASPYVGLLGGGD